MNELIQKIYKYVTDHPLKKLIAASLIVTIVSMAIVIIGGLFVVKPSAVTTNPDGTPIIADSTTGTTGSSSNATGSNGTKGSPSGGTSSPTTSGGSTSGGSTSSGGSTATGSGSSASPSPSPASLSPSPSSTPSPSPKPSPTPPSPAPTPTPPPPTPPPAPACGSVGGTCTTAQVATHNSSGNCWVIYSGYYYVVTSYVNAHPGGTSVFNSTTCGHNITSYLNGSASTAGKQYGHSSAAYSKLNTFKYGPVI
jgi:hypothetical protein